MGLGSKEILSSFVLLHVKTSYRDLSNVSSVRGLLLTINEIDLWL